jgi:cell division protein FtsW
MNRTHWISDPVLVALALLASFLGLFFIFDAGYARSLGADRGVMPPEFRTQLMCLPIALCFGAICRCISPKKWFALSAWALAVCVVMLLLVPKFGHGVNGAKRWLGAGALTFQPAEFAKLAVVLFLASVFAYRKPWPKNTKKRDWALWMDSVAIPKLKRALPAVAVGVVILLVDKEPDMGTAMVLAVTVLALFLLGGVSRNSLMAVLLIGIAGGWLLVRQEPYRLDRIRNHAHRWEAANVDDTSYQSVQSELAMASGGLTGLGIGNGHAKHIIPEPTTDFIMATVGEEFGLCGSLFVLCVMAAIALRMVHLASRTKTKFGALVLYGVATWIGFQASVNFMMANAFLPAIGVPLPFISYGGSSLVALWCSIGIGLSLVAQPSSVPAKNSRMRGKRSDGPVEILRA